MLYRKAWQRNILNKLALMKSNLQLSLCFVHCYVEEDEVRPMDIFVISYRANPKHDEE
jgi:hypothetical protein